MADSIHDIDDLKLALAAGEEEAFGDLLDAVGARLRRAAFRMLASESDADDVIQDVFVALVISRRQLVKVENLNAYLFAMLQRAVARMRSRNRLRPAGGELVDELAQPTIKDTCQYDEELLNQAIQKLSPEQREIVVLKTDGQLTFAEIGKLVGVSPNTAASRYRYGLEKLRVYMRKATC